MIWNIEEIVRSIDRFHLLQDIAVEEYIRPLAQALMDDPKKAIEQIFNSYNKALDSAYGKDKSFIFAIAGGPYETIPWALYNAVGAVYPYLERDMKDLALGKILNILDRLNYADVNGLRGIGYTTGIREPLLLSDIGIVRACF